MNVSGKARRRREIFEDLDLKIIKNMKKINENTPQNPEKFSAPSAPDLHVPGHEASPLVKKFRAAVPPAASPEHISG